MANPYEIAIKLALQSNHALVLGLLSGSLTGIHNQVTGLITHFGRLRGAMTGAFAMTLGGEMLHALVKFGEHTENLSDELVRLKVAGLDASQVLRANAEAIKIIKATPGTSQIDALKIIGQLYEPLGFEDAIKIAPSMANFQRVMKSVGHKGGSSENAIYDALKSGEMMGQLTNPATGKIDPESLQSFQRYLDIVSKFKMSTHGRVTEATWLQMAQQGGPAVMNMSPEGLGTMGQMSQMMGGFRTGTAAMTMFQQMAGVMPLRTALGMQSLGMLGPRGDARKKGESDADYYERIKGADWHTERGRVIMSDAARKRLTSQVGDDPEKFAETLKKMMEAKGITSHQDQTNKLFEILGRQTSIRFMADLMRNIDQIVQARTRAMGGLGVDSARDAFNEGSVKTNRENLQKAWENFQLALAGPQAENMIAVLQKLTGAINYMSDGVRHMDPETLKSLGIGIAALAGAFLVGGATLMMAAIGGGGWLVVGIGALLGAIEGYKPGGLYVLTQDVKSMIEVMKMFGEAPPVVAAIGLIHALGEAIGWLGDKISAVLGLLGMGGAPKGAGTPGGPALGTVPFATPHFGLGGSSVGPPSPFWQPPPFSGWGGPPTQRGSPAPLFNPIRYSPGRGGMDNAIHASSGGQGAKSQVVAVSLNIDGRKIAEALSSSIAEMMEHPTSAPYHDAYSGYTGPDNQMASA
jgi:hypothetical protein